jgi:hypothetical protein
MHAGVPLPSPPNTTSNTNTTNTSNSTQYPTLDLGGISSLVSLPYDSRAAGSVALQHLTLINLPSGPTYYHPLGLVSALAWFVMFDRCGPAWEELYRLLICGARRTVLTA